MGKSILSLFRFPEQEKEKENLCKMIDTYHREEV